MSASERVEIPGSERELVAGHQRVGDIDEQAEIEVSVYVRPTGDLGWVDREAQAPPLERRHVSREEWAQEYAAAPEDVAAVESFAADAGLEVVQSDPPRRLVVLRGSVQAVADAFGAQLAGLFSPGEGPPVTALVPGR